MPARTAAKAAWTAAKAARTAAKAAWTAAKAARTAAKAARTAAKAARTAARAARTAAKTAWSAAKAARTTAVIPLCDDWFIVQGAARAASPSSRWKHMMIWVICCGSVRA